MPKELIRLDRVEWVLRRTSVAEVAARLKKQREEDGADDGGGTGPLGDTNISRGDGHGLDNGRNRPLDGQAGIEGSGGEGVVDDIPDNGGNGGDDSLASDGHNYTAPVRIAGGSSPPTSASIREVAAAAAAALTPSERGVDGANERKGAVPVMTVGGEGAEGVDDGEEDDVADRLAAIFEFLRSGNSLLLPPDLRADWESRPDIGLGLLSADDHEDDLVRALSRQSAAQSLSLAGSKSPDGARAVTATAVAGSSPSATEASGLQRHPQQQQQQQVLTATGNRKGVSAWVRGLCREATGGRGERMTYHDLRMALNTTAPRGRRSETTNDLLERRLAERRNRANEMATALWGNDRPGLAENLYRPSSSVAATKQHL